MTLTSVLVVLAFAVLCIVVRWVLQEVAEVFKAPRQIAVLLDVLIVLAFVVFAWTRLGLPQLPR